MLRHAGGEYFSLICKQCISQKQARLLNNSDLHVLCGLQVTFTHSRTHKRYITAIPRQSQKHFLKRLFEIIKIRTLSKQYITHYFLLAITQHREMTQNDGY